MRGSIWKRQMNLRIATAGDQPLLFEIHRSVFRNHIEQIWGWDEVWQRKNFASELAITATSIIEYEGCIAGYIQVIDDNEQIYIQNIAISKDFQGKRIGTQLLKGLQADAAVRSVPLVLSVFRTNEAALRLYERLGFLRIGQTETHVEMCWSA
ncbi:GNAT family N-acetyltransferase [Xanthomonas arboricola]|uniref:GNAT family N-acetyltransferase n=1 Tax=Xanthomonas arboricola TaxID=56448 RepID=UPI001969D8EF|nr:N-acetyltransferase [Xanthomonas arboricola]